MKKIVSLITTISLTAILILIPTTANAVSEQDGAAALLKELKIMQGDENGDMMLDKKVSRAEFAKIAIAASPQKDSVAVGLKQSPFRDVPYTTWYAPYVKAAVSAGYVVGYLDATYRPENTVTYEEAVTVMLRVLGYDDSTFTDAYPYGQLSKAQSLKLLDNINASVGDELDRRQVMMLAYNTLKESIPLSPSKDSTFNASRTDYVDIIATGNEDDSLGADKVYTSAGTFYKGEFFSDSFAGMTGTIYVRDNKELISFVPDSGKTSNGYKSYFVYSVLADGSIVGYRGGGFEEIDIPDGAAVYNNQTRSTYAAVRNTLKTGDTLNVKYTDNGSVDYVAYDTNNLEGPVQVKSDSWTVQVGASSTSKVFRSGVESATSAVSVNDIVYYSAPLDVVFAYTDKVTGVYEKASPTKDSPESVTISGKVYKVESVEAFRELSSSGSFKYGDTVTVLLGRTGDVAGVAGKGTASVSASAGTSAQITSGFVIAAGKKDFTNADNTVYSSYYATVVAPDGTTNEYPTNSDYSKLICSAVRVSFKNGKAALSVSNKGSVSGRVNASKGMIGSDYLADDVKILDTSGTYNDDIPAYTTIYPQRINGVTLNSSNVLYSSKNSAGDIDALILKDVTGDTYTYGFIRKADSSTGVYEIDINGTLNKYSTGFKNSTSGPCRLSMSGASIKSMRPLALYPGQISNLTQTAATIGTQEYLLSDSVVVYHKKDLSTYMKIPLEDAISGSYRMTAYYDKAQSTGGRIRIIIAENK